MLRSKNFTLTDTLSTVEIELRSCRDQLEKVISDRECLKRQTTSYLLELDRLKQVACLQLSTHKYRILLNHEFFILQKWYQISIFIFCLCLQEKESLESKNRLIERELSEIKDKLQVVSRGLNNAATNISSQQATVDSLRSNKFFCRHRLEKSTLCSKPWLPYTWPVHAEGLYKWGGRIFFFLQSHYFIKTS